MKWLLVFCMLAVVLITMAVGDGEIWEEDDHEVLIRSERGAKSRGNNGKWLCTRLIYYLYIYSSNVVVFIAKESLSRKSCGSKIIH